jgi:hypothetical protein
MKFMLTQPNPEGEGLQKNACRPVMLNSFQHPTGQVTQRLVTKQMGC